MTFKKELLNNFFKINNLNFKLIALVVTLVLWVMILGRKNSVMTKDIELEILVKSNYIVSNEIRRKIRVQLTGPRMVLKKYAQNEQSFTIDLWDFEPGKHKVVLDKTGLNLPVGLKVISIYPRELNVVIKEMKFKSNSDNNG